MKTFSKVFLFLTYIAALTCLPSKGHASTAAAAFKEGSYQGAFGVNFVRQSNEGVNQEFGNGFLSLNGESGALQGFKIGAGFTVLAELWEDHDGDADDVHGELLNLAYIQHAKNGFTVTLGRQEVDLEWIGDYHEAFSIEYSALKNLTITALVTRSLAVADPDEISDRFEELRDSEGHKVPGYALEMKYEELDKFILNGYFFGIKDLFKGYGLKVDYDAEQFGAVLHFAASSEDVGSIDDGSIVHGELRGTIADLALRGGYIKTDNDAGAGSLSSMGDNINPLEDGNYVYDVDAGTWYAGAEVVFDKLFLAALCGETKYGDFTERELNFIASYDVLENLTAEAILVKVAAEDNSDDYTRAQFMVTFTF